MATARFRRKLSALHQVLAQLLPLNPLHGHVQTAAVFVSENLHNTGMIEVTADLRFPLKPGERNRIVFHLGMRDFDGNRLSGAQVRRPENRRHSAAGRDRFNQIVVDPMSGAEGHGAEGSGRSHSPSTLGSGA